MSTIKINDLFWTVQGEGANAGRRALFVRMPYCNLKCTWCDTSFDTFKDVDERAFQDFALREPGRFAVVTGGEPALNKQTPRVIELLKSLGFEIAIESNGTFPIPDGIDFVTISPKSQAGFKIDAQAFHIADEFKYVVDGPFDFKILVRHDTNDGRRYSLSPEYNWFDDNVKKILDYIKEHPKWRVSLQTHKWMNIP